MIIDPMDWESGRIPLGMQACRGVVDPYGAHTNRHDPHVGLDARDRWNMECCHSETGVSNDRPYWLNMFSSLPVFKQPRRDSVSKTF